MHSNEGWAQKKESAYETSQKGNKTEEKLNQTKKPVK